MSPGFVAGYIFVGLGATAFPGSDVADRLHRQGYPASSQNVAIIGAGILWPITVLICCAVAISRLPRCVFVTGIGLKRFAFIVGIGFKDIYRSYYPSKVKLPRARVV